MKMMRTVLIGLTMGLAFAACAAEAPERLLGRIVSEKMSREGHAFGVRAQACVHLADVPDDGSVRLCFDIKVVSTHPNRPADNAWLRKAVNGCTQIWGADGKAIRVGSMGCGRGAPLENYTAPGEWFPVVYDIPVARINGKKITMFDTYMYNDTKDYKPPRDDGNVWNNDTGVKLAVRNVRVLAAP